MIQKMDPVFEACDGCGKTIDEATIQNWFARIKDFQVAGLLCEECFDPASIPGRFIAVRDLNRPLEPKPPVTGKFKTVKTDEEVHHARTQAFYSDFWRQLEQDFYAELQRFTSTILHFTFSGPDYKGIMFTPVWEGDSIVGLDVAGDTPSKKFQLNIYQTHRLKQMGFVVSGERDKVWSIELEPQERDFANVARIITHVMEFGYMMRPQKIAGFTPVLDIDARDWN